MTTENWVNRLRESFAAVAAGGQVVPMGDNGAMHRSLAARLVEIRMNAALGRVRPWPAPRARESRGRADDTD